MKRPAPPRAPQARGGGAAAPTADSSKAPTDAGVPTPGASVGGDKPKVSSQDVADFAAGGIKTTAAALTGNVAGAVVQGAKTLATTKIGRTVAVPLAVMSAGRGIAIVALPIVLVIVLVSTFMALMPVTVNETVADVSAPIETNAKRIAVHYGTNGDQYEAMNDGVQETLVPWELMSALHQVQANETSDAHTGPYALSNDVQEVMEIDEQDLEGHTQLVARLIDEATGGKSTLTEATLLGALVPQYLEDDGKLSGELRPDEDNEETAFRYDGLVKIWVPALMTVPLSGMDEDRAIKVLDTALAIAGGVAPPGVCIPVDESDDDEEDSQQKDEDSVAVDNEDEEKGAEDDDGEGEKSQGSATPPAPPVLEGYSESQMKIASTITSVGYSLGATTDQVTVALMTALVESGLKIYANNGKNHYNYNRFPDPGRDHWLNVARMSLDFPHTSVGSDADSVGVFQQRASAGWGGPLSTDPETLIKNLMSVEYNTRAFFGGENGPTKNRGLFDIDPAGKTLGQLAQAVQISAFPGAYDKRKDDAVALLEAVGEGYNYDSNMGTSCFNGSGSYDGNAVNGSKSVATQWGGHQNGKIPNNLLCAPTIPGTEHHRLRCDAAESVSELSVAYKEHFGVDISLTSTYRTYASQVAVKAAKGKWAATPGKSNHGWGLAIDFGGGINRDWSTPQHKWMIDNAPSYGWINPEWARPTGSLPEPWHWEYQGMWDS